VRRVILVGNAGVDIVDERAGDAVVVVNGVAEECDVVDVVRISCPLYAHHWREA
jgi:hypothetical protein